MGNRIFLLLNIVKKQGKNVEFISKLKSHIESKQMTFRLMKSIDCGNENMRKSRKERKHINYLWEVHDEVQQFPTFLDRRKKILDKMSNLTA